MSLEDNLKKSEENTLVIEKKNRLFRRNYFKE